MRAPALVPQHVPLAVAAEAAKRHGFVLRTVRHEGRLRIAMVRADEGEPDARRSGAAIRDDVDAGPDGGGPD